MTDFIAVYDGALDAGICDQIIERFETCGQKQRGVTGSGVNLDWKDSYDINLARTDGWRDLYQSAMRATTQHLLQYALAHPFMLLGAMAAGRSDPETGKQITLVPEDIDESIAGQLLQKLYRPGEIIAQQYLKGAGGYHHWHSEIYPTDESCEALHRVLLFMFYLNTVQQGGETAFYYQRKEIEPVQGRMVIAPAGFTHTHKGNIPQSDDKYILTSWVLFNRAEVIRADS